ncbi:MAG: hypothetical protein R3C53_03680 [Pirellulaceae bacterium]
MSSTMGLTQSWLPRLWGMLLIAELTVMLGCHESSNVQSKPQASSSVESNPANVGRDSAKHLPPKLGSSG